MIVQEFRRLVEERGVVFVAFHNEFITATKPVAAIPEIWRYPANEEVGTPSRDVENPSEHCGGGRFSMRSATTIDVCPGMKYLSRICAIEQYGIFSSRMASSCALPREMALPITARSGAGCRCSSENPSFQGIPSEFRRIEAGGYTPLSEPVT